jgi:hypothetical protein
LLNVSSNRIKDNIHSIHPFPESTRFIVNNSVSAKSPDIFQIGVGGGRDYMKASPLGQLHGIGANVACSPMDEYGLPSRYVGIIKEHLPSGD